jgi:hypothetical protein
MLNDLMITVSGPDKSGKGHLIAAIAHALTTIGVEVKVQGGETHNKKKLEKLDVEIAEKLKGKSVVILEQQTQ